MLSSCLPSCVKCLKLLNALCAVPTFMSLVRFGLSYDKYPALKKYYDAMKERPSVVSGIPPHWKEEPNKDWLADV